MQHSCQRDYGVIKSSLLDWKGHDVDGVLKPVVDFDLHLRSGGSLATGRVNELCAWASNQNLNLKCSVRHDAGKRFKSARRALYKDAVATQREKSYEFKHFDEIGDYMEQYRREHGVSRQSSAAPLGGLDGHVMRIANRNLSQLQLQFWKCEQCPGGEVSRPDCHHSHGTNVRMTSKTSQPLVQPFASDSAVSPTPRLTPHLRTRTESPTRVAVSATARAQMTREALMAHRTGLYGKPLNSSSVIRISSIGGKNGEESRSRRRGASQYMRRVARSRAIRYQDDLVEDMSESCTDEMLTGRLNKQAARKPITSTNSSASLESTSSNQLTYISLPGPNQLSLQPSPHGPQQPKDGYQHHLYKLARPKVSTQPVYRLGKRREDIGNRNMAVVTPLLPRRVHQESDVSHPNSSSKSTNCRDSERVKIVEVIDCKSTPHPVEGLPKQLTAPRRVKSRGGGWRTTTNQSPFGKSIESGYLSAQQNCSSSPSGKVELKRNLDGLLHVKGKQSEEEIAVREDKSEMDMKVEVS